MQGRQNLDNAKTYGEKREMRLLNHTKEKWGLSLLASQASDTSSFSPAAPQTSGLRRDPREAALPRARRCCARTGGAPRGSPRRQHPRRGGSGPPSYATAWPRFNAPRRRTGTENRRSPAACAERMRSATGPRRGSCPPTAGGGKAPSWGGHGLLPGGCSAPTPPPAGPPASKARPKSDP